MEHYYKTAHVNYKVVPPLDQKCLGSTNYDVMKIIYPKKISNIHIPINIKEVLDFLKLIKQ